MDLKDVNEVRIVAKRPKNFDILMESLLEWPAKHMQKQASKKDVRGLLASSLAGGPTTEGQSTKDLVQSLLLLLKHRRCGKLTMNFIGTRPFNQFSTCENIHSFKHHLCIFLTMVYYATSTFSQLLYGVDRCCGGKSRSSR